MAAFDTVEKLVGSARSLLQDTLPPYRYPDDTFVLALNHIIADARRLRPDLFLKNPTVPFYTSLADPFQIDAMYAQAFVYGICGQITIRDAEDTQDQRAANYSQMFTARLLSVVT